MLSVLNCWLKCMLLDPITQADHPECKSRPDTGLSAITELDPGYITGMWIGLCISTAVDIALLWNVKTPRVFCHFSHCTSKVYSLAYGGEMVPSGYQELLSYLSLSFGLVFQAHCHPCGESGSTGWWNSELSPTPLLQCLMTGVYLGQCWRNETFTFTSLSECFPGSHTLVVW